VPQLSLNNDKLEMFFRMIERAYKDVPYHNRVHAADVVQRVFAILRTAPDAVFTYEEKLICLMAAIVHDVGHTGVSNGFLIASRHPLARRYNDRSPWEQYHASSAFEVLASSDASFMEDLPDSQVAFIRQQVIRLVRYTDMLKHIKLMNRFAAAAVELSPDDPQSKRLLVLCLVLKCADVGHTTSAWPVHVRWVDLLQEELFRQGDLERACNLPLSPMTDRHVSGDLKTSQVAFYDVVVLPMLTLLVTFLPGARRMLQAAQANRDRYVHQ
jgi:hypothetical protein